MSFSVRFSEHAEADLIRLYQFILDRDASDLVLAERALDAIKNAIRSLETSPFSCRKAQADTPFFRELIIPFGASGYVALFEIEDANTVTVLALRHQREDDYH
ncbi:type II toxin-antitoxin system RelE/ParE family toxin [Pseudoduganella violacea]|uniref:Plasmid stabilization system protein ParE n=1 Tax=Pseudoduganella violacea TaxID=1715466 RepID=A0A7W5B6J5_9BURK|nr:type II toxin-antitoxin system RelE/ParE family toxin [Pseudoduganella violacea]MBB3117459.1 plasmid stabilization system protein ParE [Pseudoduganella violacea]